MQQIQEVKMKKSLRTNIFKLAREIAKTEGKKSQAKFGDIEEILKIIAEMEAKMISSGKKYTKYPTYIIAAYAAVRSDEIFDDMLRLNKKRNKK